jgi:hypothetical protein
MESGPARPTSWLRKVGQVTLSVIIVIFLLAVLILVTAPHYDWGFLPWHWAREYNPVK